MSEYQALISKLDEFIRKYYKNELLKGGIFFFAFFLSFFLFVLSLEYFGHFNTSIRTFLFYSLLAGSLFLFAKYFLRPLLHLYKIGKIINHEQAAEIIGSHFTSLKDKLLNTLQLRNAIASNSYHQELLEASINQRIREIKPLPFGEVIDVNKNRKNLKYVYLTLGLFLIVLFIFPSFFQEAGTRLIAHNTYFAKPAPFQFNLLNKDLKALAHSDFQVEMKISGKEIPSEVYIDIDGMQFLLDKENKEKFSYTIRNLTQNFAFRFYADGFYSEDYLFEVEPKPSIVKSQAVLSFPSYLSKKPESLVNSGDLTVPAGTRIEWSFSSSNADFLEMSAFGNSETLKEISGGYVFASRMLKNTEFKLFAGNKNSSYKDSISYQITVIPDLFPEISLEEKKDSSGMYKYYFTGLIKDDYGFRRLTFNYKLLKESSAKSVSVPVKINPTQLQQAFFYYWDLSAISIEPGQEYEYYFEVWDNDGVTGSKSTKSQVNVIKLSTKDELAENLSKSGDQIKADMKETIKQSKQIQKELTELSRKLRENKEFSWEDKRKAEQLLQKQNQLQRNVEDLVKKNEQHSKNNEEVNNISPEAKERQDQLKEIMESFKSEEMKKLSEELAALMEKLDNKQLFQEKLDEMKSDNKDVEKELSRSLELFKKLEVQQKLEDNINKLKDLAKQEKDLSDKTDKSGKEKSEELKKQQEELTKKFEKSMEDLAKLEKEDKALEFSNDFKNPEDSQKDIQKDMKESEEELSNKNSKKASKKQNEASKKMEDLSDKLSAMKAGMEGSEMEEDINALRALLDDLLKLSFNQEELMSQLKKTDVNNPQYLSIGQKQLKLKENAKMIEDSLFALSKRVVQIKSIVNKEIAAINENIDKALYSLEGRDVAQARGRQQYAMTSLNNLALLLNESLKQMQEQAANAKPGAGSCKKPGGKSPKPSVSLSTVKKMQEQINQQMEKLAKEGKQEGKSDGGKDGKGKLSEQVARLAAQQQALRRELQKIGNDNSEKGKGNGDGGNLNKLGEKMEQTEKDLVNKKLTPETFKRQQEIMTRLLEAEKAEREREQEDRRESNEGKSLTNRNPEEFIEYKRIKLKEMELIRTVPPALNSFYKQKSIEYFNKIGN